MAGRFVPRPGAATRRGASVAVVLVALAACGGTGSSREPVAAPTTAARVAPGATDATGTGEPAVAGAGAHATSRAHSPTAPTSAPRQAAAGSDAPPPDGPAPAPDAAAGVGARPGTYTYRVSGTRSSGTPPTTQPVDGSATLVVDAATATGQRTTGQRTTESRPEGTTETTFRFRDGAVHISHLKVGELRAEFAPDPPVLAFPDDPATGTRWSWEMTSTDGKTTLQGAFHISGTDVVRVGDGEVDCIRLEDVVTVHTTAFGPPVTATVTDTRWVSAAHGLTVRLHTVTDAGVFGRTETTSTIQSLVPS